MWCKSLPAWPLHCFVWSKVSKQYVQHWLCYQILQRVQDLWCPRFNFPICFLHCIWWHTLLDYQIFRGQHGSCDLQNQETKALPNKVSLLTWIHLLADLCNFFIFMVILLPTPGCLLLPESILIPMAILSILCGWVLLLDILFVFWNCFMHQGRQTVFADFVACLAYFTTRRFRI